MDLDKELVRAILRDGLPAFRKAIDKGVTSEKMYDDGKLAWEFIEKHVKQYSTLPSLDLILSTVIGDNSEPIDLSAGLFDATDALIDKVSERSTLNLLLDGAKKLHEKVSQRDAKLAAETFNEIHRKLQKESLSIAKIESLFALGKDVINYYNLIESGGLGIPTPWPTMTSQTRGWWPEDLILIISRLGVGKSWFLLINSHVSWMTNHKVILCTTEMTRLALATRFLCIHFHIPYGEFMSGRLGDFVKQKMFSGIDQLLADHGIQIVGNGFDFTMDGLESAVEESTAEVLALDGAYLIKNKGKDRQEQVINNFNDLKRIGIRKKIAILASSQFNRQAKADSTESITIENIGITDVAGWNATAAFGLYQTETMKNSRRMGIKPLKIREGMPESFETEWNFSTMSFCEVNNSASPTPLITNQDEDEDMF